MAIFRFYSTKSNTIASGADFQYYNSSQNPVADLWYGCGVFTNNIYRENSISRHLIMFDLTAFTAKTSSYEINPSFVTSYRLKMKNSVPSDTILEPEYEHNILNKNIASSFDIIAFLIPKSWDEGRGYDLTKNYYLVKQRTDLRLTGYSNWLSATTLTSWDEPGIYFNPTASTGYYGIQHFETGGEDLNIDVTNLVKHWLSGGSQNYGLALAYSRPYEALSANSRSISSFFTNKTNSGFKPFIEASYNQVINDDRNQVVNNRVSRLFLYTFSGNVPTNYFSAGTVSIRNSSGTDIYTGLVPTLHSKGVYYVDVWMSGTTKGQKYKDIWNNVSFSPPYDQTTITQNFEIKDNYYTTNARDINEYVISTYGIDNNSTIVSDELRRVYVDARVNFSLAKPVVNYGLEYKLVQNKFIEVIPWTQINSAIINGSYKGYIDIDASWLLTNQNYEIQFRISDLGTKKMLPDKISFKVVNNLQTYNI